MNERRNPAEAVDLLVFELAGVKYALALAYVREVTPAVFIRPLPDAPAVIEGIIDVRGQIVPVYDLRLRFGHDAVPLDPGEQMIIAWTGERRVAMRCERTDWISRAEPAAIGVPDSGSGRMSGVVRLPDGLALIHDLPAFLDEAERGSLNHALSLASQGGAG